MMSRLARAIEILEAINKHFYEGADCVYRDGLILDDDATLADAIAECLEEPQPAEPVIPHSQRKHIGKNFYGDWVGFIGKRKAKDFGKQEEAARQWLWGV